MGSDWLIVDFNIVRANWCIVLLVDYYYDVWFDYYVAEWHNYLQWRCLRHALFAHTAQALIMGRYPLQSLTQSGGPGGRREVSRLYIILLRRDAILRVFGDI